MEPVPNINDVVGFDEMVMGIANMLDEEDEESDPMIVTDSDSDREEENNLLTARNTERQTTNQFKMTISESVLGNDALLEDIVNDMAINEHDEVE